MKSHKYLNKFLIYIAQNPEKISYKQFVCSAWRGTKSPLIIGATPIGLVNLYPDYLVFLTTSKAKPGSFQQFVESMGEELAPYFQIYKFSKNPLMIIEAISKSINISEDSNKFVQEALSSPNSFIIPLKKITKVKPKREFRGNFIYIYQKKKSFTLYQNAMAESPDPIKYLLGNKPLKNFDPFAQVKLVGSYIKGKWQEDFVEILQEVAERNK